MMVFWIVFGNVEKFFVGIVVRSLGMVDWDRLVLVVVGMIFVGIVVFSLLERIVVYMVMVMELLVEWIEVSRLEVRLIFLVL